MQGRGLQRAGLNVDDGQVACAALAPPPVDGATRLQFVPVLAPAPSDPIDQRVPAIHIELRHGSSQVAVHWPTSQAAQCAAWLRELTAALLK
jgi:hypothetical protein